MTNNALESSVASIDTAVGLRRSRAIDTLALAIDAEGFFDLLANDIEIVKALFRHLLDGD